MNSEVYDVVVIGAGPAGASIAILLAKQGRRVVVVDRSRFPRDQTSTQWLSKQAKDVLVELDVATKALLGCPFHTVTFYNADFSKTAKPSFSETPGYLIDRAALDNALAVAVRRAGIALLEGSAVTDIRLTETSAILTLADGARVEGRLLMLAPGTGSPLRDRCGFPSSRSTPPMWTARVDVGAEGGSTTAGPHVDVVLGLDRCGSFGVWCVAKDRASVAVNWLGERDEAIPTLINLCKTAFERKVVRTDLSMQAVEARPVYSPAAEALDMDSHVGKHTLLIGDAGGFISAASSEGIYPAMWSARIAAEVADAALGTVHSQDELMSFDSKWRMQMADYLRSPNTDIQFLLPLIFSNQPMADRMGAAFFAGKNI